AAVAWAPPRPGPRWPTAMLPAAAEVAKPPLPPPPPMLCAKMPCEPSPCWLVLPKLMPALIVPPVLSRVPLPAPPLGVGKIPLGFVSPGGEVPAFRSLADAPRPAAPASAADGEPAGAVAAV